MWRPGHRLPPPSAITARRTAAGTVVVVRDGPDGAEFKVYRVLSDGRRQIVGRTHNRLEDGSAPEWLPVYHVVAIRAGVESDAGSS